MLSDYIGLRQASQLIPTPSGKPCALGTIRRWILSGKLPAVRRGRWWFVRRADVLGLFVEGRVPPPAPAREPAWVGEVLRRAGLA